jgi:protein ECT2
MPVDTQPVSSGASVSSGGLGALHCTLFLFDDRLIIVKRPNGASSGRTLARLGEIEKLLRTNALNSLKKSGMSCKGVVDVLDITATDAGGPDLHVYLENPPEDQTDRWNGRPFRSYAVVLPPSPLNLDPTVTEAAKKRFLNNLWTVQALYRVKNGRCLALKSDEHQVGSRAGQATLATAFYNIYQRTPYLGEPKKVTSSPSATCNV